MTNEMMRSLYHRSGFRHPSPRPCRYVELGEIELVEHIIEWMTRIRYCDGRVRIAHSCVEVGLL
jgi:hypothetical protein